jgi:predicted metal-dependent hydrolase
VTAARNATATGATVESRGRRKAYRPMPPLDRRRALDGALAAYAAGDYFAAHELLEPAWLGTADPAERELYGGIIKLAAAYVHDVRGNPAGVVKNLRGARERLVDGVTAGPAVDIDVGQLLASIDRRMAAPAPEREPAPTIRRIRR